jgi:hypothetical protein
VGEKVPCSVEAVALRSDVDRGYIQAIANGFNTEDNALITYNAQELRTVGTLAQVRAIGREASKFAQPADVTAYIEYLANRLHGVLSIATNRSGDAASVSGEAWQHMESGDQRGVLSGVGWLDDLTGGFWPGMNWWWVGAYKMGKSSAMRNCVLASLDTGHSVDVFCAEGSRELFALDMIAMIATQLLCERNGWRLGDMHLSGHFIRRVWRTGAAVLRHEELEAIREARAVWDGYDCRVWDTVDGIRDLATLRHRVQRSRLEYGTEVIWYDYSQLAGREGTLYERQSRMALTMQELAAEENIAVCVLAQQNEAKIRDSSGYSAGVKGGGDAAAAADFVVFPRRDLELDYRFYVELKFSRHTGLQKGAHVIDKYSGLFLDTWFDKDGRRLH